MLDGGGVVEEGDETFFDAPVTDRAKAFLKTFEFHRER